MKFSERYKNLNDAQKLAVDTIDGPVMVIAGPGTGKTELLSMRAANIMQQTDTLPENILCLTFTEAGSIAMQKRLRDIIGRDAYHVSIYTFHSFGSEIMNRFREFFYSGANFSLADDLARHKILSDILDSLQYDNPLKTQMNGKYTAISDIMSSISDLKRAGLTNVEFDMLLNSTESTVEIAAKHLYPVFTQKITKSTINLLEKAASEISRIQEDVHLSSIPTFQEVLYSSINRTLDEARAHEKTTPPITEWKKHWMTYGPDKSQILKVQKALPKLRALNLIYEMYLQKMQKSELIDYDDMIMQVVHAIEVHDDLRMELQEKYQYIMVDEFQDTNLAQMRILHNLMDNPVNENRPNILVVGDDDQAIYGFQGAEVSNILNFEKVYNNAKLISLTENYRSVESVLAGSRDVITQGDDRLENKVAGITKSLNANLESASQSVDISNFDTTHSERKAVAESIAKLIQSGTKPSEIAVIARKHSDLVLMISYLTAQNIPISYDRRDNVLDDEVIRQLELVGKIIHAIGIGNHNLANTLLPEMLAHPAWDINPTTVWHISLESHKQKQYWLETMKHDDETEKLFSWLMNAAISAQHLPLERMMDIILGVSSHDENFTSPLKSYFFSDSKANTNATDFMIHLNNLSSIRQRLREHSADMKSPKLADFINFMEECRDTGTTITSMRHIGEDDASVSLVTAHGSKGLEFDNVYIINATDSMWGEKARGKTPAILYPPHIRLRKQSDDYDERLRLFYVAMTRARFGLHISFANENDSAKEMLMAAFLLDSKLPRMEIKDSEKDESLESAEHLWYAPIINIPSAKMRELLAPTLTHYKLSATHVNNFLDVTSGGPKRFMLNTLLRFPSAPSAAANYGIAVHSALQRAHDHLRSTHSHLPEEDILHEFERQLERMELTDDELQHYMHKGCDALSAFLKKHYNSFNHNQIAEFDFARQDVIIGEARLTGKLDVVETNNDDMTVKVIDYKTGSPLASWDKGTEYQKIKAHKYRQQLLFYKLLIENSKDLRKYNMREGVLQFVEPDVAGDVSDLSLSNINMEELDRFAKLLGIVWEHIQNLTFPDTSGYEDSVKGIIQFENDLLDNNI